MNQPKSLFLIFTCTILTGCDPAVPGADDAPLGPFDPAGIQPVATIQWTRLLGSTADDIARGVAVAPDGSVYVTGTTEGDLGDKTNNSSSGRDVFLAKYDANGTRQWVKLLGATHPGWTGEIPGKNAVGVDADGRVYVTGWTRGGLPLVNGTGLIDGFVVKTNEMGNVLWATLIGEPNGVTYIHDLIVGRDGLFVTGSTAAPGSSNAASLDVILAEIAPSNGHVTIRSVSGSSKDDVGIGIAMLEAGFPYPIIVGGTKGSMIGDNIGDIANQGGWDLFTGMWRGPTAGVWTATGLLRQLGSTSFDRGYDVAAYTTGSLTRAYTTGSSGTLPVLNIDNDGNIVWGEDSEPKSGVFLLKETFSPNGLNTVNWVRYLPPTLAQGAYGAVAADAARGIFLTGGTQASFADDQNQGDFDIFLAGFHDNGSQPLARLFGTSAYDIGTDIALATNHLIYLVGSTEGNLDNNINAGVEDAFVMCVSY
ncbi:MAG: SBBP repeat-containing protein [Phycisphaerae bacterium]